ncbi:MAG TPA: hypothetical protein PKN21_12955 [Bacteroidales bacterium]|jgi:hypothetical protein|nr:hypothetical protein [Bacteroidales bacterium]
MEESSTTSPLPVSEKPSKSQIELKQLNHWQNKLLPWLVIMPTLLILLFIYLATRQMQQFNAVIDAKTESSVERILTAPSDPALDSRLKGDMDYVRWVTLARMEEKSLDRRYNQGGLLLASRIFTKYLGFFTGMILAIVGAIFIIGKLQESSSDIEGAVGDQMKLKIVSSSPGIIFGVLGTVLMLSTILQHAVIELKDQPLFLNSYNIQVNSVDKGLPVATPVDNNTNSALMDSLLKAKP